MNKFIRKWLEWRRDALQDALEKCGEAEDLLCSHSQGFADRLLVFHAIKRMRELRDRLRKIERKLA